MPSTLKAKPIRSRSSCKRAASPIRRASVRTDPVGQYAQDVVSGKVVAGRAVRLACERHLRDLDRQNSDGFPYHFEADRAGRIFRFFGEFLHLDDGGAFVLEPWQAFILGSLIGWVDKGGNRRFRTAYVETGKGSGKTPMSAGLGLYGLIGDGERASEIYSCGVTRDQADYLWRYAKKMAEGSPHLRRLLGDGIGEHNIAWRQTNSYFRPLSSEKRSLDNKLPHMALIDEIHEHPSSLVVDKMRAGTKGRKQALVFMITNSGYDRNSVCWRQHEYSLKVLEQREANETWFAYVCQLDACPACLESGVTTAKPGCPNCDRWDVEGPHWLKANPNLGVSLPWSYLREQVTEAIGMPAKANIVRRLNFCEWTESSTRWLDMGLWDRAAAASDAEDLKGRACFAGLDLASVRDLTAFVLVFPRDDGGYDTLCRFWVPEDGARRRSEKDRVPYLQWIEDGWITATAGNVTDYDRVREDIRELAEQYDIRTIAYDRWNASQLITQLTEDGANCVPVGQGFASMTAPAKELESLVLSGTLRHGGNPVLRWMAGNAVAEIDAAGNVKPSKAKSTERIDGVVALTMALSESIRQTGEDESESVYDGRGLLALDLS